MRKQTINGVKITQAIRASRRKPSTRLIYCKGFVVSSVVYYDIDHFGLFRDPYPETHHRARYNSAAYLRAIEHAAED